MNRLARQVRFDYWANRKNLTAIDHAAGDISEGVKIAGHIAGINELWLARVERAHASFNVWPQLSLAEVIAAFDDQRNRWLVCCDRYSAETAIHYTNNNGRESANSFDEIVQEVALHSAHHRGQIALLLRMRGSVPPDSTDFIPALRQDCF